jgi:ApbE superfamily uncharacterized protein (UPF0280 family)
VKADNPFSYINKLTVYISLSVADAKTVLTRSTASASDSGVTASCNKSYFNVEVLFKNNLKNQNTSRKTPIQELHLGR